MENLFVLMAVTVASLMSLSSVTAEETKQGHWGEWGPLSPCSVTCGSGTTTMERVWIPGPSEKPYKVPFTSTQVFSCSDLTHPECPQNGTWSGWGAWSGCTKPCGTGIRERHRECRGTMHGGKPCEGEKFNQEDCNRKPCPPLPKNFDMSECMEDTNFTCTSKKMCVPISQKCDDTVQCHDGSDEENCPTYKNTWGDIRYDLSMRRNSAWSTFSSTMFDLTAHLVVAASILLICH